MAAEYEVNEIGYIGSIWNGITTPSTVVGKTIQVTNVPNTIEAGGWAPFAAYFTNKDDIDLNAFNRQLPFFIDVGKWSYNTRRLNKAELDEIYNATKISTDYLSKLDVVYYLSPRGDETLIPIQDQNSWGSFKDADTPNPTYYFSSDVLYLTKYVFLVKKEELDLLKSYFLTIQSQETIFDPPVLADPTAYLAERMPVPPPPPPKVIDFKDFKPPVNNPRIVNDIILEALRTFPFPKKPYHNDIHEDAHEIVAIVDASEEFSKLIQSSPEQFYISLEEGDAEYNRLTEAIQNSIKELQKNMLGSDNSQSNLDTTTTPVNTEVIISSDGGVIIGD